MIPLISSDSITYKAANVVSFGLVTFSRSVEGDSLSTVNIPAAPVIVWITNVFASLSKNPSSLALSMIAPQIWSNKRVRTHLPPWLHPETTRPPRSSFWTPLTIPQLLSQHCHSFNYPRRSPKPQFLLTSAYWAKHEELELDWWQAYRLMRSGFQQQGKRLSGLEKFLAQQSPGVNLNPVV